MFMHTFEYLNHLALFFLNAKFEETKDGVVINCEARYEPVYYTQVLINRINRNKISFDNRSELDRDLDIRAIRFINHEDILKYRIGTNLPISLIEDEIKSWSKTFRQFTNRIGNTAYEEGGNTVFVVESDDVNLENPILEYTLDCFKDVPDHEAYHILSSEMTELGDGDIAIAFKTDLPWEIFTHLYNYVK